MKNNRQTLEHLFETGQIDLARGTLFDVPPGPMPEKLDFCRVEGMMLGLAIGDALGATTEGKLPSVRRAKHGEIRDYLPNRYAEDRPVGLPSDDTQLAFWTLEQMLEDGGFDPKSVAARFCQDHIYNIGSAVRRFIANHKAGRPWYECGTESAGNGALMRIAPMLIPHLRTGTVDLWVDTALSAMITHNDAGATAACLAFAQMLWQLLAMEAAPEPAWWLETYVETSKDLEAHDTYRPRGGAFTKYQGTIWRFVQEYVSDAYSSGLSVLEACNAWYSAAYLLETVPSVLYILMRHGDDPEEAIVRAVNDTKDNDTIAAIVGAAVGALHGKENLPSRWIGGLLGRTTDRDDGRVFWLLEEAKYQWWYRPPVDERVDIQRQFARTFAHWSIELPGQDVSARRRGEIHDAGWRIQYLFGREDDREYLDYYAGHHMTTDSHVRIWENGEVEHLETPEFVMVHKSDDPGDKEHAQREYYAHNRRVYEILEKKGFGWSTRPRNPSDRGE